MGHDMEAQARDLAWPETIFDLVSTGALGAAYNQSPCAFRHNLAGHPLFSIDRLAELCRFLERDRTGRKVVHYNDAATPQQGWRRGKSSDLPASEALLGMGQSHSWVLMKDIQTSPDYRQLPELFIADIERTIGRPVRDEISWRDVYLFVASPGMVTPYHIDHECNFLLQLQGAKTIHLFSPDDRAVLSENEIERYYSGDVNAAQYHPENASRAVSVQLEPGVGVHHPPLAPHWVQNGAAVSVSLSFLYFLRSFDRRAKIYQTNHLLRAAGMSPRPPGEARMADSIKAALMSDFGRQPQNKDEVVRHAYRRITAPLRMGRRLLPSKGGEGA